MKTVESRDLETRHLQALDAIVATGTFARAARRLGYTQSAVSQQVAALERAVGGPVFDRGGGSRRAVFTALGQVWPIGAEAGSRDRAGRRRRPGARMSDEAASRIRIPYT